MDNATFVSIWSEFGSVPPSVLTYWMGRAGRIVDTRFGLDQDHATGLLTAHYLTINGLGDTEQAEMVKNGLAGIQRLRSASLHIEYSQASADAVFNNDYQFTTYGRQFYSLLRVAVSNIIIGNSGTMDIGTNYPVASWPY